MRMAFGRGLFSRRTWMEPDTAIFSPSSPMHIRRFTREASERCWMEIRCCRHRIRAALTRSGDGGKRRTACAPKWFAACPGMEPLPYPAPSVEVAVNSSGDQLKISNFFVSGVDLVSLVCWFAQADLQKAKSPAKCP
jgi:hypothetical protein